MINGFDELLQTYVYEYGGGLFTVGGDKQTTQNGETITTANAYNRKDLMGSIYQEMLPVEAINYTTLNMYSIREQKRKILHMAR